MVAEESDRRAALIEIANRMLPGAGVPSVARAEAGVSTPVYRLERGGTTLYARLAESPGISLQSEVVAHERIRALGVRAPDVVHHDEHPAGLDRALMVTTAIPGRPVDPGDDAAVVGLVLREAGRDLALINSVPVDGFGWVRRDRPDRATLSADLPSPRTFAFDGLAADLAAVVPHLGAAEVSAIEWVVDDRDRLLDQESATLAHGDFDRSHVFVDGGAYGGIIDFGEIRGTDRFYDLGHFALHDGDRGSDGLTHLLTGYADVTPLPPDTLPRIRLWSLLIGIRRLAIIRDRPAEAYRRTLLSGVRYALAELQNG